MVLELKTYQVVCVAGFGNASIDGEVDNDGLSFGSFPSIDADDIADGEITNTDLVRHDRVAGDIVGFCPLLLVHGLCCPSCDPIDVLLLISRSCGQPGGSWRGASVHAKREKSGSAGKRREACPFSHWSDCDVLIGSSSQRLIQEEILRVNRYFCSANWNAQVISRQLRDRFALSSREGKRETRLREVHSLNGFSAVFQLRVEGRVVQWLHEQEVRC